MTTVRLGTRGSALALAQSGMVAESLSAATGMDVRIVPVRTQGDTLTGSLATLGGTGVFASELRSALLSGEVDVVVHSFKDLPTAPVDGIAVAAVPLRADVRDALVGRDGLRLAELPAGARVGTGSPRRRAQLLVARPDLDVVDVRGNVDTRIGRVGIDDPGRHLDAVILAAAGLERLGRLAEATELFEPDLWPTAPAQGALAVETRTPDVALAAPLDDPASRLTAEAERGLLALLEAGCAAPVAGRARVVDGALRLSGHVYAVDGTRSRSAEATAPADPAGVDAVARAVADALLAAGAADLAPLGDR